MTVWEPDERQILPAGTQNFPFNFRLPPNLPPTFQGNDFIKEFDSFPLSSFQCFFKF